MAVTPQEIRDIATCFAECDVFTHNPSACVVKAPDADQADGVQTLLQRNGIKASIVKANFTKGWYVIVMYKHQEKK